MNKVGEPLTVPKAIVMSYTREIVAIVNAMIKDYRSVIELYAEKRQQMSFDDNKSWLTTDVQRRLDKLGKDWEKRFVEFAKAKSPQMVRKVLKQSDTQLKFTLRNYFANKRFELIMDKIPEPMQQTIKAHIAENTSLIRSIAQQYIERINGAVYRAITGGGTMKELRRQFIKFGNMSYRRAKLVASDQVHKTFTTLAARRMTQLGIKKYVWYHSHAVKEPRPYHIRKWDGVSGKRDGHPNGLNGFVFDLDHPPVIDEKTGERGLPGRLPYCKCRLAPYFGD